MSSILTNSSAITALQNLAATQKSLQMVQNQISTGLKVSSAADNASIWSTASSMQSDNEVLGVVQTSLAQGQSMTTTAYNAASSSIDVMNTIKQNLVAAKQPGADLAKIQSAIAQASAQLGSIVSSSSYNGQNWVDGSKTSSIGIVASFDRADPNSTAAATTPTTVGTIDITPQALIASGPSATKGSGILEGGTGSATSSGTDFTKIDITKSGVNLDTMIADADKTLSALQSYASNLGATQTRLTTQAAFISKLSDAMTQGIGALQDADMNQASTKLQALQTQQQLGVQSLAIANQNTQMIMKLFG